jgi:hypothetical protein
MKPLAVLGVLALWQAAHAPGSDPDAAWFAHLQDARGISCCNMKDCFRVSDSDLETRDGHYRIRFKGEWLSVPEDVVLHQANPTGFPVACVHELPEGRTVRCFVPASQV